MGGKAFPAMWEKLTNPANWSVGDVGTFAGVAVALLVAIGGFIKWFRKSRKDESNTQSLQTQTQNDQSGGQGVQAHNIDGGVHYHGENKKLVDKLVEQSQEVGTLKSEKQMLQQENDDLKRQLSEAIESLESLQERTTIGEEIPAGITNQQLDIAIKRLREGDTEAAENILLPLAEAKKAEGEKANKEAAELYQYLGAFYFLHDSHKALRAYQQSVDLDPDDAGG